MQYASTRSPQERQPRKLIALPSSRTTGASSQFQRGQHYLILNNRSGFAADIEDASTKAGARVISYPRHAGPNQQWLFEGRRNGYFRIRSVQSGKCLQAHGVRRTVVQRKCGNSMAQQWKLPQQGDAYFIQSRSRSLVLGERRRNTGDLVLQRMSYRASHYQTWVMEKPVAY
ncbi:RICIN domain-containing protein [Streptomyces sp. M41]|uniref:RICIN domain-containing protein n=1 Tax=Streptomyces sp. M41 TaxID=3059412 RepID=UPI00374D9B72